MSVPSATGAPPGFTAVVAETVVGICFEDLPAEVLERTRHAVLDWTGVTVAGAQEPSARAVQRVVAGEGDTGGASSVLGTSLRCGPQQAALANGVAAHVLDFDDGNRWAGTHPSAPVLSAVLALAEARGRCGREVVAATVAGVQALCLIGYAIGPSHYAKGFHTTGTIGTFGAAAGCARLLGLDAPGTARALGLAATQAAGSKAVFGTMGKHLNAGRAAASGVLAAQLAAQGFDAPADVIESAQGFARTQSTTFDAERRKPGGRYGIEHVLFKRYACCADTHSAIEGVRAIAARRPLHPDDVLSVHLGVSTGLLDVCDVVEPCSGTQGRFSVRYVTALALSGASAGPADFTDEAVRRPALRALAARVQVEATSQGHASDPITVTLTLRDGSQEHAVVNPLVPVADDALDAQWRALTAKFDSLVVPVLGTEPAAAIRDAVRGLAELDTVADLVSATVG